MGMVEVSDRRITGVRASGAVPAATELDGVVDESFMRAAVVEATRARDRHEVPVGAIVSLDGLILGRGCNQPIHREDPTAHAEIVALRDAARTTGNYRLTGATLYVTVEPCVMCTGALLHARIARLVYGAVAPRAGAVHSALQVLEHASFNHRVEVTGGVLEPECRKLIQSFFAVRRMGTGS